MKKLIMAALVSVVFIPSARAATVENDLFVCTGELIKNGANDYSIKETWRKNEDYPTECYIHNGKILQQVLSVCRVKDVCVVSAKGESGNGNRHLIQKVFEVQRSRQTVEDFKSMESAIEYRWTFAMGAGSASAQIENSAGSEMIISCLSGNQFNIPTITLESKLLSKSANQGDLYVQFVIDGKNFPVSFEQGTAAPGSRNRDNENANFITALSEAKSKSFTAEYPDLKKMEKFSALNVRDAVGAIVEGCLNAPIENKK